MCLPRVCVQGLLFRSRGTACLKSKPVSAHICSLTTQARILEQFAFALAAWLLLLPQAPWLPLGTEASRPLPYHWHLQSIGTASPYFLHTCCLWVWPCMSRGLALVYYKHRGLQQAPHFEMRIGTQPRQSGTAMVRGHTSVFSLPLSTALVRSHNCANTLLPTNLAIGWHLIAS